MDENLKKTVFLPGEFTIAEQYRLIKQGNTNKNGSVKTEQKIYASKISGNHFFKVDKSLYKEKNLFIKALNAGYSKSNLLITSLIFTKPFYNFVTLMKENYSDKMDDLECVFALCEMLDFLKNQDKEIPPNIDLGIEESDTKIFTLFDTILKLFHSDFVKKYFFVEDVWQDPSDLKIYKKVILPEFSPIVGIFHFEVLRSLGKNKSEIDTLSSISIKSDDRKISEIIEVLYNKKEKSLLRIKKWPHVLAVKIYGFGMRSLCQQIKLSGKKYSFESCVFVNAKKETCLIVEIGGAFYLTTKDEVSMMDNLYFVDVVEELIVFYSAMEYDFE